MAASGYTPILIYASGTASNVPSAANLTSSASGAELALNYTDGKLYFKNNSGVVTLLASAAGASGDVVGPASATDNAVARFDLTTGKLIQNSVVIIGDTGDVTGVGALSASGNVTLSGGTANGVTYLNGSKVLTSGSALTFDGTNFTTPRVLFGGSTLPAAGNPSIALRSSDNVVYHQSGSANNIVMLDSAQNTMQSIGATAQIWNISNSEQMRLTSTGLGIGTSSPSTKLYVLASAATPTVIETTGGTAAYLQLKNTGGSAYLGSVSDALAFYTSGSGTERMRLDSSGNLGLGVTPSAWNAGYKALEINSAGNGISTQGGAGAQLNITNNAYWSTGWKYNVTDLATAYAQQGGKHIFYTAASGTAGNAITFTQAMTLDDSGRLGIGTTSPDLRLTVDTSSGVGNTVNRHISMGRGSTVRAFLGTNKDTATDNVTALVFGVDTTERARITSGGDFGIGTASPTSKLTVSGSGATLGQFVGSGGSTYIEMDNSGGGGYIGTTGNALVFLTSTAGTERARIDSSGNLLVGTTNIGIYSYASATGVNINAAGTIGASSSGTTLFVNRTTSDGDVVGFYRAGNQVGTISVTTTATAYNTSSDYRLKDNQQPLTGSGVFIDALQPKTWNWKADGSKGIGFIAHEAQVVSPSSVLGEKDAVDEDGKPIMQAMEYGSAEFIANIIAELQSLRKRVAQLEGK